MATIKLTKENFETEVLYSQIPVLVDFYAEWCGPCKMLAPVIDEIAAEAKEFKVGKVNVDEEPELSTNYQIMSVPTLVVFKGGNALNKVSGLTSKDKIMDMLS